MEFSPLHNVGCEPWLPEGIRREIEQLNVEIERIRADRQQIQELEEANRQNWSANRATCDRQPYFQRVAEVVAAEIPVRERLAVVFAAKVRALAPIRAELIRKVEAAARFVAHDCGMPAHQPAPAVALASSSLWQIARQELDAVPESVCNREPMANTVALRLAQHQVADWKGRANAERIRIERQTAQAETDAKRRERQESLQSKHDEAGAEFDAKVEALLATPSAGTKPGEN